MLQLDFTIVTSQDRSAFVNNFFEQNPKYKPTKHELETISDYILYGKEPLTKHGIPTDDPELWTNSISRKEIEIETKYNSRAKKKPESLDALIVSPTFNEVDLLRPSTYYKGKHSKFDREQESDIPGIEELWETIDYYSNLLEDPNLSSILRYKYSHLIIELRREQFILRDLFKPQTFTGKINIKHAPYILTGIETEFDWESPDSQFGFAPMGLYHKGDLRFDDPLALERTNDYWGYNLGAKYIIDFRNPEHIKTLLQSYTILEQSSCNALSSKKDIVRTLDYYINSTKLSASVLMVLEGKKHQLTNKQIAKMANKKYNKKYSENYISTIYKNACIKISERVEFIFEVYYNRINPTLFKKCSLCGKRKMICPTEFARKSRNNDGFSSRCKECEK